MIINSGISCGRFGNTFIRNLLTLVLSNKFNISAIYEYSYTNEFNTLGLPTNPNQNDLSNDIGSKWGEEIKKTIENTYKGSFNSRAKILQLLPLIDTFDKSQKGKIYKITINNIKDVLWDKYPLNDKNIYILAEGFYHTPEVIWHIATTFNTQNLLCKNIQIANKYKERYQNNEDIFIHIRAGDVFSTSLWWSEEKKIKPSLDYYIKIITSLQGKYKDIFLASDNFDNEICLSLVQKYNCILYDKDPIDTIQFGSTCKYVIMSSGTYSMAIGVMSLYGTVWLSKEAGQIIVDNKIKYWHYNYYYILPETNKNKYKII